MTRQDAVGNLTVIQVTIFISNFFMHVLVDSRANHLFISSALAKVLGEEPENLNCRMIITTSMEKPLETSSGYKNKKIQIGGTEFLVDLILLEF